jgi:hypothetical protein
VNQRQAEHETKLQEFGVLEASVASREKYLELEKATLDHLRVEHGSQLRQLETRESNLQLRETQADERIAAAANELKIERDQLQAKVGRLVDQRIESQLAERQEEYQHILSDLQRRIQTLQQSDEQIERSHADVERVSKENNQERERLRVVEADLERREHDVGQNLKKVQQMEQLSREVVEQKQQILKKVREESLRLVAIRSEVETSNQVIAERDSNLKVREQDLRAQQQKFDGLVNEKVEELLASEKDKAVKTLENKNGELNQSIKAADAKISMLGERLQEEQQQIVHIKNQLSKALTTNSELIKKYEPQLLAALSKPLGGIPPFKTWDSAERQKTEKWLGVSESQEPLNFSAREVDSEASSEEIANGRIRKTSEQSLTQNGYSLEESELEDELSESQHDGSAASQEIQEKKEEWSDGEKELWDRLTATKNAEVNEFKRMMRQLITLIDDDKLNDRVERIRKLSKKDWYEDQSIRPWDPDELSTLTRREKKLLAAWEQERDNDVHLYKSFAEYLKGLIDPDKFEKSIKGLIDSDKFEKDEQAS